MRASFAGLGALLVFVSEKDIPRHSDKSGPVLKSLSVASKLLRVSPCPNLRSCFTLSFVIKRSLFGLQRWRSERRLPRYVGTMDAVAGNDLKGHRGDGTRGAISGKGRLGNPEKTARSWWRNDDRLAVVPLSPRSRAPLPAAVVAVLQEMPGWPVDVDMPWVAIPSERADFRQYLRKSAHLALVPENASADRRVCGSTDAALRISLA